MKVPLTISAFVFLLFSACEKYDESPIELDEKFSLFVTDTNGVRADGRSVVKIMLVKSIEVKDSFKVLFSTNKGTLLNAEQPFIKDTAVTYLTVAQDTGIYFIKTQVKKGSEIKNEKMISFSFQRAFPDNIFLEPDRLLFNFATNDRVTLQTYLSRVTGLVSKGATVNFRAYQLGPTPADTVAVGRFSGLFNNFSGVDGKLLNPVTFYTDTQNVDSNRVVYLTAFTNNDQSARVAETITLRYRR